MVYFSHRQNAVNGQMDPGELGRLLTQRTLNCILIACKLIVWQIMFLIIRILETGFQSLTFRKHLCPRSILS